MMATLLIVDDDTLIRETLRSLLIENHECHTADRAEQALAFLEFENYDAILTDLAMPGLSGRELLEHVKKTQPGTPVIVISGMSGDEESELLQLGAYAYFTKPFQLDEIEEAVTQAVNSRTRELDKSEPAGPPAESSDAT
jgi:two-component system response regulator AtoC